MSIAIDNCPFCGSEWEEFPNHSEHYHCRGRFDCMFVFPSHLSWINKLDQHPYKLWQTDEWMDILTYVWENGFSI